mmetsp:Transcript_3031/g.6645  ORF Transcript_3031/g.6645 Transcript_3031/m.6645 type:complete len:219 (+) Transcript_3031:183-839(+)
MGIVHIPRTAAAVFKGLAKRQLSPLSDHEKSLVGIGSNHPPHVYSSRAGLFDVDLMFHMNNASYLTHAELARWEWTAFGGTLAANLRTQSYFIVTASMIRFRREIGPWKKFDIETRLVSIDTRNLWVYQTFHHSDGNERGKVLAQVFTQGVITNKGKVIDPRSWVEEHVPAAEEALDDLNATPDEVESSLFDEKSTRFADLEQVLRRSAALHDDKVTK